MANLDLKKWIAKMCKTTLIGEVKAYAGSTEPSGWLTCDGTAVSRTTYAKLFSVIGTTYGAGDGSTTFNLPNLSGRTVIGESSGHVLASSGGSEYIQDHTHSHTNPSVSGGAHSHSLDGNAGTMAKGSNYVRPRSAGQASANQYITSSVAHTHTVSGGGVGGVNNVTTGSAGNMQPFLTLKYLIYAGGTA